MSDLKLLSVVPLLVVILNLVAQGSPNPFRHVLLVCTALILVLIMFTDIQYNAYSAGNAIKYTSGKEVIPYDTIALYITGKFVSMIGEKSS